MSHEEIRLTVVGIEAPKKPTVEWIKMRDAWNACTEAGVEVPAKVKEFFGGQAPDKANSTLEMDESVLTRFGGEGEPVGFYVDLKALKAAHPTVKKLRVKATL